MNQVKPWKATLVVLAYVGACILVVCLGAAERASADPARASTPEARVACVVKRALGDSLATD